MNINNKEYTEWLVIITIVLCLPFPSFAVVCCLLFEHRRRFQRRFFFNDQCKSASGNALDVLGLIPVN